MPVVTIHHAKTNLVIIARGDKPVARLVPVGEAKGKRQPGSLKGKLQVRPEMPLEELAAWE